MARIISKLTYPYTVGGLMITHGVNDFEIVEDASEASAKVRADGPRKVTAQMLEGLASNPLAQQRVKAGKLVLEGFPKLSQKQSDKGAARVEA